MSFKPNSPHVYQLTDLSVRRGQTNKGDATIEARYLRNKMDEKYVIQ